MGSEGQSEGTDRMAFLRLGGAFREGEGPERVGHNGGGRVAQQGEERELRQQCHSIEASRPGGAAASSSQRQYVWERRRINGQARRGERTGQVWSKSGAAQRNGAAQRAGVWKCELVS